jgi:histidinol-phosphate/aromatic aminotransferase/cobyric acid decarboxylase-like protein
MPFASDSFIEAVGRCENLVVMYTVSKLGLVSL